LWTTLGVAHRVHTLNNNRPEQNENCVTHVPGQICYLCPRLLTIPLLRVLSISIQVNQASRSALRAAHLSCDKFAPYLAAFLGAE
jgi:hypothetical protein